MSKASFTSMVVGLLGLLVPAVTQAQRSKGGDVPAGHRPPPGMCRIWVEGVPAGQQPAATDCATAVRTVPRNGRVIFGDERPDPRSTREPMIPKWASPRSEPRPEPRQEPDRRSEPRREEPRREEPRREEPKREERRRPEKPRVEPK
ncbi:MAG TPA: hypothetical protein VEA99_09285 [Gemmatimonadaceae bacterium]|nr:hypothetical protein [Gemmatimonadaceae bacterium]